MPAAKLKQKRHATKAPKDMLAHHKRLFTVLAWVAGVLLLLCLLIWVAFQISPWPNALLIRNAFNQNSAKVAAALQKYVPPNITEKEDVLYRSNDPDAHMDVFTPSGVTEPIATIVWVHGGGWVSGSSDDIDNYMKILAGYGFTTISVNYSIAPEKQYPVPIEQLNDALGYIQKHADELHVNDTKLLLAGDSAGSQIVAQMANIITSPSYSAQMGISPTLPAYKLKGLLLNCGAYDLNLPDYNGPFGQFLRTVLWAYSGTPNFLSDPKLKTASVVNYVTPEFPPTFITAGNADPLLTQSTELAAKLNRLGVTTSMLFYSADHTPALNHEYQFNLDTVDGQNALRRMVSFAKTMTE